MNNLDFVNNKNDCLSEIKNFYSQYKNLLSYTEKNVTDLCGHYNYKNPYYFTYHLIYSN